MGFGLLFVGYVLLFFPVMYFGRLRLDVLRVVQAPRI